MQRRWPQKPEILRRKDVSGHTKRFWTLRQVWVGRGDEDINIGRALRELRQMQKDLGKYRYRRLHKAIEALCNEIVLCKKHVTPKTGGQVRKLQANEVQ